LALFIDKLGIVVRTGHHCATDLQISGNNEFHSLYNTKEEIDTMVEVKKATLMILTI
jgi:selenocysteine lyase/cysteine desulfurase